jgi:hypothetical protein
MQKVKELKKEEKKNSHMTTGSISNAIAKYAI